MSCRQFPGARHSLQRGGPDDSDGQSGAVGAFCHEPMLLAFSRLLCTEPPASGSAELTADMGAAHRRGGSTPALHTFCESALFECLAQEKAELLPTYLQLYHLGINLRHVNSALPLASIRLLSAYYGSHLLHGMRQGVEGEPQHQPTSYGLQPAFVSSLTEQIRHFLSSIDFSRLAIPEGFRTLASPAPAPSSLPPGAPPPPPSPHRPPRSASSSYASSSAASSPSTVSPPRRRPSPPPPTPQRCCPLSSLDFCALSRPRPPPRLRSSRRPPPPRGCPPLPRCLQWLLRPARRQCQLLMRWRESLPRRCGCPRSHQLDRPTLGESADSAVALHSDR